jgi:hypothetical protein
VALDSPSKEVKDLVGEEDGITAARGLYHRRGKGIVAEGGLTLGHEEESEESSK